MQYLVDGRQARRLWILLSCCSWRCQHFELNWWVPLWKNIEFCTIKITSLTLTKIIVMASISFHKLLHSFSSNKLIYCLCNMIIIWDDLYSSIGNVVGMLWICHNVSRMLICKNKCHIIDTCHWIYFWYDVGCTKGWTRQDFHPVSPLSSFLSWSQWEEHNAWTKTQVERAMHWQTHFSKYCLSWARDMKLGILLPKSTDL